MVIDFDEESLNILGQWPWPRHIMADIVTNLKAMGAKVIAFDVVFSEADRTSPRRVLNDLPTDQDYSNIMDTLMALPDNERAVFSKAIAEAGNVVTGFSRARPEETLRNPAMVARPTFLLKNIEDFYRTYISCPRCGHKFAFTSPVLAAGNGSFMATPDIDGIIRQVSLFNVYPPLYVEDKQSELISLCWGWRPCGFIPIPKGGLLVRPKKDKEIFDANYVIKMGDIEIPIEDDSKLWVHYRDIKNEEYISAHRVLKPEEQTALKEKLKENCFYRYKRGRLA